MSDSMKYALPVFDSLVQDGDKTSQKKKKEKEKESLDYR